jgi:amidase
MSNTPPPQQIPLRSQGKDVGGSASHASSSHPGPDVSRSAQSSGSLGQSLVSRRALMIGGVTAFAVAGGSVLALRNDGSGTPPPAPGPSVVAEVATPSSPINTGVPTPAAIATAVPAPITLPLTAEGTLLESTVGILGDAIANGTFTIVQLVQAALDRIAAMDDAGVSLHAVIEVNPDAIAIAQGLDDELKAGNSRGRLHGIPVLVKDIFASADGMKTTAGALALAQNTVVEDSFVVQRLRDSGAIVLGKTNMSEWSGFRSSGLGSGWSGRGGQAINPYMLDKSPWGSSSGSAISVAASYVPLAIGAETDGSIICPAAGCGVVGMKPTVGLVSRRGVIPIGFSQDSPGPLGRNVRDVAILLSAIAGYDDQDPSANEFAASAPASKYDPSPIQQPGGFDYTSVLEGSIKGFRVGIARGLFGWDADADNMMEQAISVLGNAGVQFIDDLYFETDFDVELEYVVLITEFKDGTQRFFDRFMPDGPVSSLSDVMAFNEANPDVEMGFGDQVVLERTLDVGPIDDPSYEDARTAMHVAARENGIDATMDGAKVDVLIAPTAPVPSEISSYGDAGFVGSSATPSAMSGYPAISIPIGLVNGLPVGMNIFGRAFSEKTLLQIAYGFEQILQARTPPTYIPGDPSDDPTPPDPATEDIPVDDSQPSDSSDVPANPDDPSSDPAQDPPGSDVLDGQL